MFYLFFFFFFNDTATTEIYTLSYTTLFRSEDQGDMQEARRLYNESLEIEKRLGKDRKSTRLNSSHLGISYAVFCLKKKKKKKQKKKNTKTKKTTTEYDRKT